MKRILSFVLLIAALFLLSSCAKAGNGDSTSSSEGTTEESYKGFDFVTYAEKLTWRDSLVTRLIEIRERFKDEPQFSIALIDVNLDGVPEIACSQPGGTSGNTFFYLVDMKTGKDVGSIFPGYLGDEECGLLAVYLDTVTKRYTYIGECRTRIGWGMIEKYIYTISIDERGENYGESILFKEVYSYEDVDMDKVISEFYIGKTEIKDFTEYFYQKEKYMQSVIKTEGTDIVYINWSSVEGENDTELANSMADSLINSTQTFLKANEIPQ